MTSNAKDIIKLRPVSKAIDEDESSRLKALEFEVPRKYCAQISPEMLRFTELKRSVQQHRTHILKKLMKIARYTQIDRQFEHISDLDASEKVVPHGEVSKRLYSDIFKARDFDLYGKMMPPTSHAPRKHMELAVTAQNLGIEYTQKVDNELVIADILKEEEGGDEEEGGNEGAVRRTRKLLTQKWKIGYVDSKKPPVGFAKNPGGQFRSHGNEYYYSYDGEWRDGKMDGSGVYLFSDGFTYEGRFKEGQPDGQGVAYYPDGQRYEGQWGGGRYKGRGETFALSGSKYEGEFDAGRRSGTGTITYPSGLSYTGDFYDGRCVTALLL